MEDVDDDFGELYADVAVQGSSAINGVPDFTQSYVKHEKQPNNGDLGTQSSEELHSNSTEDNGGDGRREMSAGERNDGENGAEVENGSESDEDDEDDDDFDVVVNDDDYEAKNGGADERRCCEGVKEEEDGVVVRMASEVVSTGKNQAWVDRSRMEENDCGGEREKGVVAKNGCNMQLKNGRSYGSMYKGNQRAVNSREHNGYGNYRRSSYGGSIAGFPENGNGFWLPWYRTILDVDIDTFEHRPWMLPGADMTDYFNFGFDVDSWKGYCLSLDALRQQTFRQVRNQDTGHSRPKLEQEAVEFIDEKSFPRGINSQIGRAILVEDSNTERLPSMDARPPRDRDSDVVIEITVQAPEDDPNFAEKPRILIDTKCEISQNGFGLGNIKQEDKAGSNTDDEIKKRHADKEIRTPSVSSDLKRSPESATVSSHLQESSSHGKGQDSETDTREQGTMDGLRGGYTRAVESPNTSMEDSDRYTTETNPCVAGIDSLSDDHIQGSPTPSNSDIRSEASKDGNCYDWRITHDCRRSSSDSAMKGRQLSRHNHDLSRQCERGSAKIKASISKKASTLKNSNDQDQKHSRRRVRRHSGLNSDSDENDKYHIGMADHLSGENYLRARHHRPKERRYESYSDHSSARDHLRIFDEGDRSTYRESFHGGYDERSVRNQVRAACRRDSHQHDSWGRKEKVEIYSHRDWDQEHFFSERRIRRTKDEVIESEWYIQEREHMVSDGTPLFQNRPPFISKYFSSTDMRNRRRDFDDIHYSRRSQHDLSLEHEYNNGHPIDRYPRSDPLNDWEGEYVVSDIDYERRVQHFGREVGISGRRNQFFENPLLDRDCLGHFQADDDYCNRQRSPPIQDYRGRHSAYSGKRHEATFYRDGMDDLQMSQRYERHDMCTSLVNDSDDRGPYDYRGCPRFVDEDDYVDKRKHVFDSRSTKWTENAQFYRHDDDLFHGKDMLDSVDDISWRKHHDIKQQFGPSGMNIHTQIMKHNHKLGNGGGGGNFGVKNYKFQTKLEHEQTALRWRNSVELHHVVRERKALQRTGKFSKAESEVNNDASAGADGRFEKQEKKQRQVNESRTEKVMEGKSINSDALQDKGIPVLNRDDASDLEEGQIPTEEPSKENPKKKKHNFAPAAENDILKRAGNLKFTSQGDIDESRIQETMAKMEKRRERFRESGSLKKETDRDLAPVEVPESKQPFVEIPEPKPQRPARKRRWGGS